ncbi:MAG TPA: cupin domain-containing protein [Gaiellaceae bacterium]
MSGYQIVALADLDRIESAGNRVLRPLRHALGVTAFGVNAYTGDEPGDVVVEQHREIDGAEELYVVVSGRATFTLDGEMFDAPTGTLVHAPPGLERVAVAAEAGTTVLAVGADIGKAFTPSGWESFMLANAYRQRGELAAGRALIAAGLASAPSNWASHYNAACFESLAGDVDAALVHVRQALALDAAHVRKLAPTDSDLDSLRTDQRFAAAIG